MVSGTRDNPSARDNFAERLYGVVSCNSCPLLPRNSYLLTEKQLGKLHIGQNDGLRKQFEPSRLG